MSCILRFLHCYESTIVHTDIYKSVPYANREHQNTHCYPHKTSHDNIHTANYWLNLVKNELASGHDTPKQ